MIQKLRALSSLLFIKVLSAALGLITAGLVTRLAAPEAAAFYFSATSAVMLAATIARGGADSLVIKGITGRSFEAARTAAYRIVASLTRFSISRLNLSAFALLVAVFIYSAATISSAAFSNIIAAATYVIILVVTIASSAGSYAYIAVAGQVLIALNLQQSAFLLASIPQQVTFLAVFFFGSSMAWNGSAVYIASAIFISYLAAALISRKALMFNGVRSKSWPGEESLAEPFVQAATDSRLLIAVLAGMTYVWGATLVVDLYFDGVEVAVFGLATRISGVVTFVAVSINSLYQPLIREQFLGGDKQAVKKISHEAFRVGALAAGAIALASMSAPWAADLFLGNSYHDKGWVITILLLSQSVVVWLGWAGNALVQIDEEKSFIRVSVCVALLAIISINIFGSIHLFAGAVLSLAAGAIVNAASFYIVFKKKLNRELW